MSQSHFFSAEPSAAAPAGITIVYEDRAAGLRGKRFSDMLVATLGSAVPVNPSCWRSELIELPAVAAMMADCADRSDFLILSLRGDRGFSREQKHWIETWADRAAGGPGILIALFDPERATVRHAASARLYLRQIADAAGLGFFAHCSFARNEPVAADVQEEPPDFGKDRMSQAVARKIAPQLATVVDEPIHPELIASAAA